MKLPQVMICGLTICNAMLASSRLTTTPEPPVEVRNNGAATVPVFRAGFLLVLDPARAILRSYKDAVSELHNTTFALPGVKEVTVRKAAIWTSGEAVVAATVVSESGQFANVLIWVTPQGSIARTVLTTNYAPMELIFAPDGSLWTVGRSHDNAYRELAQYDVLRRYSRDGRLLGTSLARELFRTKDTPLTDAFLAANTRNVYLYSATSQEVFEFDLAGTILRRRPFELPRGWRATGFAVVDGADVFVSAQRLGKTEPTDVRAGVFELRSEPGDGVLPVDCSSLITARSGGIIVGARSDDIVVFHSGGKLSFARVQR